MLTETVRACASAPCTVEEAGTASTLESVIRDAVNIQVVVVDGSSTDNTVRIAMDFFAKARVQPQEEWDLLGWERHHAYDLLHSPAGRGKQMSVGIRASNAPLLAFAHGDYILPPHYNTLIRTCISKTISPCQLCLGAFRLKIEDRLGVLSKHGKQLMELVVHLRARLLWMLCGINLCS